MRILAPVVMVVLMPEPGFAHGSLAGGSGFYGAASHPFLAVEQFLALSALGILLGKRAGSFSGVPVASLAIGMGLGMALDVASGRGQAPSTGSQTSTLLILGLSLGIGVALAAAVHLGLWIVSTLAGVLGWVVAVDTDLPAIGSEGWTSLAVSYAGLCTGVFLIVLNAAALARAARRPPFPIVLRIVGSWTAAISLMVLALRIRGPVML